MKYLRGLYFRYMALVFLIESAFILALFSLGPTFTPPLGRFIAVVFSFSLVLIGLVTHWLFKRCDRDLQRFVDILKGKQVYSKRDFKSHLISMNAIEACGE